MISTPMIDDLNALNEVYGLNGAVRFDHGNGRMPRVRIAAEQATAEIYLQGAHVTQWQPAAATNLRPSHPGLFLSERSHFVPGKAIRGGVPLIFPWFADRGDGLAGPMHGFVRSVPWSISATETLPEGIAITFAHQADAGSRSYGFDHFSLRYRVIVGTRLQLSFEVRNCGASPLMMEEALHAYFAVGDIRQVTVSGLAGTEYLDRADSGNRKRQQAEAIHFAGETDQLHMHTTVPITIHDRAWQRRIVVEKQGSASTVVWNPWLAKATALDDLGADAWPGMVCVEPANAREDRIEVPPGGAHTMAMQVRIEPFDP